MAQVINRSQRTKAFWKFFLFFIISVAATVGAVFFNFEMPRAENKILRKEKSSAEQSQNTQQRFTAVVGETYDLLDSLAHPGVNTSFINSQISNKLTELTKIQSSDSTNSESKMNQTIVLLLSKYQQDKMQLLSVSDALKENEKLKTDLSKANSDLEDARKTIEIYRRSNNQ